MNFIFSLLPTAVVLGVLIMIHEFGHFIACRLLGVRVEKFSIGFGPEIFHWAGKETRYALSLLPLGGFVKPAGETVSELENGKPKSGDYLGASLWVRMLIVVAGVAMNYVLAFILFTAIFLMGRPVPGTTIGSFVDGYPAKTSGLMAGDRIVQMNDAKVMTWADLMHVLETSTADDLILSFERKTEQNQVEQLTLTVKPKVEELKDIFGKQFRIKRLGITPNPEANVFEQYNLGGAITRAWDTTVGLTVMTYKALYYLILGKLSLKNLAGPIGIVSIAGSAAKLGLPYLLQLMATLSVSLAVINLLPVPALDGGHFMFLLVEGIRRKQVSLAVQEKASQIGFILLMVLMVLVLYNDLVNIAFFEKIKTLVQSFRT